MPAVDPARLTSLGADHAILDVRAEAEFSAGHLAGAGNLPVAEFAARRTELPPREAALVVVAATGGEAEAAAAALAALGYRRVDWLDAALAAVPGGLAERTPAVRLWRPAPFLMEVLPHIRAGGAGARRALDLAAGAGREAVFLAMNGFDVEALDDDPEILARAEALAARCGVRLRTQARDLERRDPGLGEGCYDLITVFRFLHRPLFPHIERALAPGGWLVYETFRRGQERFGRPTHPRFLLDAGELSSAFPNLAVERYAESDPEGGPITARLLARRPVSR
ncbi:MAG: methyltransferase domain-containing protein [Candidatus Eisenbacteria bacterium]|uniref:Methyltransferase domain-containing protein n=1 Tax=Eiseniibacteriota bacterium TaxID=2212470 RepID=A0A538UE00_UNCEI|nr:MAG: methyltransferase domain-containing protein [Candidatus Eisenbacteria bacterium]